MKKVLLAYDGSAGSNAALETLSEYPSPNELEVMILNVADVWIPPNGSVTWEPDKALPDDIQQVRQRVLQQIRDRGEQVDCVRNQLQEQHPSWHIKSMVATGPTANVIVAAAAEWGANLIMLGSQPRHWLLRWLRGSVSRQVLRRATCAVQIAKTCRHAPPDHSRSSGRVFNRLAQA